MLKKIIGIACLLLIANSQIIRLSAFQPCGGPTVNPQLAALHRVMAPINNDPAPPAPVSLGPALPTVTIGLPNPLPILPPTYGVRPNPIPLPILPGEPSPSGPKLCSCGHHYVNEPVRPAKPTPTPICHEEDSSDSSEEDSSREEGKKCRQCGGKDCKCSVHNPSHQKPKPQPKPLIRQNGKTCDKCKDGKCECSDCKCANCREEDSSRGPTIKPVRSNLAHN